MLQKMRQRSLRFLKEEVGKRWLLLLYKMRRVSGQEIPYREHMLSLCKNIHQGRGQVRDAVKNIQRVAVAACKKAHMHELLQALCHQEQDQDARHNAVRSLSESVARIRN